VEWPAFDGGIDRNKIKQAESSWRAANDAIIQARDHAIAEVWRSYTNAKTAIARRESAEQLVAASKASYDALFESFNLGRTSIQDVLTARSSLAQAMALHAKSDEAIAASLATLTYSSGQL
jgi:outer membrane protein TolC